MLRFKPNGFFRLTYKIIGKPGLSTNKANEAVEFHIAFYDLKVVLIDVLYSKSVTHNHEHAVSPLLRTILTYRSVEI